MCFRLRVGTGVVTALLLILSIGAFGQDVPQLAKKGVGLLPQPAELPATLQGALIEHPFVPDPSGGYSRIVFESDENPDFKIVVRDYAVSPAPALQTLKLAPGAILQALSGLGEVSVGENRLELNTTNRLTIPPNATLSVTNRGEGPVVVRALTLEPK